MGIFASRGSSQSPALQTGSWLLSRQGSPLRASWEVCSVLWGPAVSAPAAELCPLRKLQTVCMSADSQAGSVTHSPHRRLLSLLCWTFVIEPSTQQLENAFYCQINSGHVNTNPHVQAESKTQHTLSYLIDRTCSLTVKQLSW